MKTLLKYDLKIQQIFILLFILTILTAISFQNDDLVKIWIIGFFLLAAVQYAINTIKYFNTLYQRTTSRKMYMVLSTYVVSGLLTGYLAHIFEIDVLKDIFGIMTMSWVVLSPVLICQSLFISFSDYKTQH